MANAVQVQWRRGTAAQNSTFTGAAYEITIDITNWRLILQDGITAGGRPVASEAYVQAQIAGISAGVAASLNFWSYFR